MKLRKFFDDLVNSRNAYALRCAAFVISFLACLSWTACPGSRMPAECREFFSAPASEREKHFKTYDLEKQLSLYRCGMNRRPPASSLSLLIADRGESAIPTLLEKLQTEKDELFQYAIIDIFRAMSVKGALRGRRDVVDQIEQVVARMKISTFREMAEEDLADIKSNSLVTP